MTRTTPKALVSNMVRMKSAVVSAAPTTPLSAVLASMPALLTSTSRPPSAAMAVGRGRHRRVVGDVDEDRARAQPLGGPAPALGVAAADVDGVAGGDELAGGLEAQALVRAGDQCRRHVSRLPRAGPVSQPSGLPGTGGTRQPACSGGADWGHGDRGVRAGGAPLAGPGVARGGRAAGGRAPARGRAAPRGTGPAGRDLRRLHHPAGAGPGDQPVGAGRRGAGPGAAAGPGRARAPVPAGRAGAAGPGDGARATSPRASSDCWTG